MEEININPKFVCDFIFDKIRNESSFFHNGKRRLNNLVVDVGGGFFCGVGVDAFKKNGCVIADIFCRIYWEKFRTIHEDMMADAPYPNSKISKWEMSALIQGFEFFVPSWPNGGFQICTKDDLSFLAGKTIDVLNEHCTPFFQKYSCASGIIDYIGLGANNSPGNWRITLEFIARSEAIGIGDGCAFVRSMLPVARTGYEKHQAEWLIENFCCKH